MSFAALEEQHGELGAAMLVLKQLELTRERKRQQGKGGLLNFVRYFWEILEPDKPFSCGWALEAMCLHLEAVSAGHITRLLVNVPPGAMKSLLCDVFWPGWEWSALGKPGTRYLCISYSSDVPERDNRKMRDLIKSEKFVELYGDRFSLQKDGEQLLTNDKTGSKQAAGMGGSVMGNRADRIILDDPNSTKQAESEPVRTETARFFREGIRNRLNDLEKSAIIVIQQRVHEDDISGVILSEEMDYDHLCIPLLVEDGRRCQTSIGWQDPRTEDGECFWPERYPPVAVAEAKEAGEFAFAGQYQQRPEPRGGGLIKRDYWQAWDKPEYPRCDYVLASLDPAFTAREENDPAGFTIWGTFEWRHHRAAILLYAWRKRYELHGPEQPRLQGEPYEEYRARTRAKWGLVEAVADSCKRYAVDHLLIENKASGITVSQEMYRLHSGNRWTTELIDPKRLDKMARLIRVQPIFSAGQVFTCGRFDEEDDFVWRAWAQMVIDEMAAFPRGKYDDLTDSSSQALWWLRERGFLTRETEAHEARQAEAGNYKTEQPLYPIY